MVQHVGRYAWAMDICRGRGVVDQGCGDGYETALLSSVARTAIGIDISPEAVWATLGRYPGVEYRVGGLTDADAIPREEIGMCFEVLVRIAEAPRVPEALGTRISRALVSMPTPLVGGSHINPHHVKDWPLGTIKRHLREAGALAIHGYHQTLRRYPVKRGAFRWDPFWLFDVRFT
jgi:hypothetical protein